jgi:transcription-repair coupling factor (superfamily II helicase)
VTAPLASLLDQFEADLVPDFPGRLVVPPPLRAVSLAGMARHLDRPVFAVLASERDAEDLVDDVALFTDRVVLLPAWETLPFEHISPNVVTMAQRARARHSIQAGGSGTIVIASVRAAIQRVSPSPVVPLSVRAGTEVDFDGLIESLAAAGYHRTDRVEARGEFAVRGGLIDVYPADADHPVRAEFWGDEVDEIRSFAVASQRSIETLDHFEAYPARELRPGGRIADRARELAMEEPWAAATWDRLGAGLTFQGMESWLPWLAPRRSAIDEAGDAALVVFDPVQAEARSGELVTEEAELAEALAGTWGADAPAAGDHPALYLDLGDQIDARSHLAAPPAPAGPHDVGLEVRGLDATPGDPESIAKAVNLWSEREVAVIIAMDGEPAANRVAGLLAEAGAGLPVVSTVVDRAPAVLASGIHRGFVAPFVGFGVVGEQEVAGRRRSHRRGSTRVVATPADGYRDLSPGSFVVHRHHGIGRFEGLVHREMAGVERDYLLVAYHGADRLYVPTDQLGAVRPYTGGETPRLSRMGGTDWETTRSKVRKAVAVVAEKVVALHRMRAQAEGRAADEDTPWQAEFEAAFPYEETPDQLTAIADVKQDMEQPAPMDRLIFGDVGFGKTEVALRAAFKAVQSGRQVAVLVPTTLLAQQHYSTFEERLASYPVRVEMLSRFLTGAQQRQVISGMASGAVDIVVGTHRLLSGDIHFRDLGLLVVDEEQRFGVAAKDRLKELRASVDVLTLTATPIPRTLEMALTGIREVSHIRTAPEDRHPILTYVGPFDEQAVSAAIRREMLREGQVFYVHNRVQSIDFAVERLRRLVPGARYAVAHGQMSEGHLEQVMLDFWSREYDVLVATTIIESGLDLPAVNTLIVERADRLGLAQLYQLRGRVGRSSQRAYAYLFHPEQERLSEEAYRRLEAIGEFSDLGSGFELAMRDLEIRGAGSVLSEVQAGHISAVGFDLYVELVADAVGELRGETPVEDDLPEIRIDLPVDAHLPDAYVGAEAQRLEAYRGLALATTHDQVDDVAAEWRDRFGEPPPPAAALLDVARLRIEALRIGLEEIVQVRREIRLSPVELKPSLEVRLQRLSPRAVRRGKLTFIPAPPGDPVEPLIAFLRTMWPPDEEGRP